MRQNIRVGFPGFARFAFPRFNDFARKTPNRFCRLDKFTMSGRFPREKSCERMWKHACKVCLNSFETFFKCLKNFVKVFWR